MAAGGLDNLGAVDRGIFSLQHLLQQRPLIGCS